MGFFSPHISSQGVHDNGKQNTASILGPGCEEANMANTQKQRIS